MSTQGCSTLPDLLPPNQIGFYKNILWLINQLVEPACWFWDESLAHGSVRFIIYKNAKFHFVISFSFLITFYIWLDLWWNLPNCIYCEIWPIANTRKRGRGTVVLTSLFKGGPCWSDVWGRPRDDLRCGLRGFWIHRAHFVEPTWDYQPSPGLFMGHLRWVPIDLVYDMLLGPWAKPTSIFCPIAKWCWAHGCIKA